MEKNIIDEVVLEIHKLSDYYHQKTMFSESNKKIEDFINLFLEIIFEKVEQKILVEKVTIFSNILYGFIERNDVVEPRKKSLEIQSIVNNVVFNLPDIIKKSYKDVDFALNEDPAVYSREEIIKCYPFAQTVPVYRLAHALDSLSVKIFPRMLTEFMHSKTGIDIHPSTQIGSPFFIDHGTGVIIGGTSVIGKFVKIFHNVTLGSKSFKRNDDNSVVKGLKRHPTIKDNVTIFAGAVILGGDTVVGENSIISSNVWLTKSIPRNTIVRTSEKSLTFSSL